MYEKVRFKQHGGKWHSLLPVIFLGLTTSLPVSAETYNLVDLGVDISPTDINSLGTIVVSRKTDAGTVAFRRLADGWVEDIAGTQLAYAVNDADQVAGTMLTGAFLLDGNLKEWDGFGGYGINELGQVSGNKQLKNPYRASFLPLDPAIYTPSK